MSAKLDRLRHPERWAKRKAQPRLMPMAEPLRHSTGSGVTPSAISIALASTVSFQFNPIRTAKPCLQLFLGRCAIFLLAGLIQLTSAAEETIRQRELWVPEKSLPHILAANPKAVVLSRAEYLALTKEAATPVAPQLLTAPTPVVLRSAEYRGQVSGNAIIATADFSIEVLAQQADVWQVLELPIPIESLGTVKLDDTTAIRLLAGEAGKPTGAATVLLRTPGTHHVTASFYLPITGTSTQQISLKRLPAAAANFTLELPERFSIALPNTVGSKKLPSGNILHTMPMPAGADDFSIQWRARDLAPLTGGAVLQTCSYLYQIDPARVTSDLGIVLRSPLARVPQDIHLPLPETARVLSVEGPDVSQWTLDGTTINVHFASADLTVTNLRVLLETTPKPAAEPGHPELSVDLPQPAVAEVHRASGSFAIMAAADVRVRSISTGGLTAQTTEGLPGDAAKQPGFVAGFAFPVLANAPSVSFQELEPRFQTDQLLHVQLRRDTVELRRTLRLLVKEGKIFTTTLHLPEGEETTSLTLADGTEPLWKAGPDRTLEIKWAAPITTTAPGAITLVTRIDPAGWFTLGENARPLKIGSANVDGPELTTGYVALDFDERFHVATTTTVGLEPTDPAHLQANGVPLTGQLTWTRADKFSLELAVSRRPSEVHAHITTYALPLLHTCELEGQIELQVRNSGLRSLLVAAPPGLAETLRFDSPLIAEKKLQPLTGEWTLTFHEELSGTPHLRYHWSLPLTMAKPEGDAPAPDASQAQSRFSAILPVLKLPEAGRVTGTYVIEANTDTELTITPQGLDDRDILALPAIDNYQPRHRVIAAYGWRGSAWQLSLEGTRHPAAPLPGMVIDALLIQSILNPDGTQRHQLTFNLRSNGEQFFSCPLPEKANILSLAIDGAPVKPVADPTLRAKNENGLRIQLPATIEARPASIQLTYEVPAAKWETSGDLTLTPPPLNPNTPILSSHWYLHLPDGYSYSDFTSNLRNEFTMPTASLASAVGVHLWETQYAGRVKFQVHRNAAKNVTSGWSATGLETEKAIITARETLLRVVRNKGLAARWKLDEYEASEKLGRMVDTSVERGTDLITIEVTSPNRAEAAELANAVGEAYEERRKEYEKGRSEGAIAMLQNELEAQDKKVEEKRIAMLTLMKKHGIIDFSDASGAFHAVSGGVRNGGETTYASQQANTANYESQLAKLKAQLKALESAANQDQLIELSSSMGLDGPTLKEVWPKYHAAKIELEQLRSGGLAANHPSVVAAQAQMENLRQTAAQQTEALRKTLDAKVQIAEATLQALKTKGSKEDDLAGDKARQSEYTMAKREYEQQSALLNEMRQHILKQKVDLEMPMLPVQRHENAVPMDKSKSFVSLARSTAPETASAPPPPAPTAPMQVADAKGEKPSSGNAPVTILAGSVQPPDLAGKPLLLTTTTASASLSLSKTGVGNLSFSDQALLTGKSGLIPLAVNLPSSGLTYGFAGNHPPSELKLHFVTWRHELQWAWVYVLLGVLLAWAVARRRPIFMGLCFGLTLHFLPQILGATLQKPCNAVLLGFLVTCGVLFIFNLLKRRFRPTAALAQASVVLLSLLSLTAQAPAAETTPAAYTAYVPFDSTKPLADQTPGRYFLTYDTFQKLWAQARANKLNAGKSAPTIDTTGAPWAGIQSALYKGDILADRLKLEGVLTIVSTGAWATVGLDFQGLCSLTLDGATAPLSEKKLLLEKPGVHTVIAKLEIPLTSNWQSVTTRLPQAAASMITLSLTDMSARMDLNNGRPVVETATAEGVPQRHLTAALGNVSALTLKRDLGARMANAAQSLPPSAKLVASLYLSPALERLEAGIDFDFPGGDRQEFAVELDPSLTPVSVDIPNVEKWSLTAAADKQTLNFRLTLPVREKLHLSLTAERTVGGPTFPSVWPVASRVERELRLLAVDELEVTVQPAASHQQTDFPKVEGTTGADAGFQRFAAYRVAGPPVPLGFKTARRTLNSALQADYLYQISPSKLEVHAVFNLKPARGQDLLHTSAIIPNGFTVTRVDSDRLQDWWVDGDRLRIRFSGPTPETTTLLLGLAQPWKEPPVQLELAPVALENIGSVRGRAQIAALPDVNGVLNFPKQKASQIRETSPGEQREEYPPIGDFKLTSPFETKREFTFNTADYTAAVTLGKVPARFDTRWVLAAEVQESWVRLEARLDLEVKSGALSEFILQLPASAVATTEPRLTGEQIREMVRLPAVAGAEATAPVRYKVSLQRPITTATQATLALEIPHQGEIHLPDLTFPEAGLNERFVVVQNASAGELHFEAKRSLHVEPLQARDVERDLHFRIQQFAQPSYFRVGAEWDIVFTLEKLATTVGTKALVLYAELTTALRANGEEWLQADYRLQNRSLQFLPVRLPEGFTLLSAIVNDQPVRADQGTRDKLPVLLIPLIQTRPGDLALQVRLVCRRLPNTGGKVPDSLNLALDDPELPGVTIERTVWRVALPNGYVVKDAKGNMDAVAANEAKFEQEAAVATELSSLLMMCNSTSNPIELRERSRRNAQSIAQTWMSSNTASDGKNGRVSQVDDLVQQAAQLSAPIIDPTQTQNAAPAATVGTTNWSWSGNSTYLKSRELKQAEITQQEAQLNKDNLGLNDNVIVGNRSLYFKYNAPEDTTKGKVKEDAKKPATRNTRSEAVSKLQQADIGDATTVGDQLKQLDQQRFAVTLDGANTYTGATTVTGGVVLANGGAIISSNNIEAPVFGVGTVNADFNNGIANTADGVITRNKVDFEQNYQNGSNRVVKGQVELGGKASGAANGPAPQAKPAPGASQPQEPNPEGLGYNLAPVVTAPQKLRPAGRVSLPISFPVDTELTFYKKVKDHASMVLATQKAAENPGQRLQALVILGTSLFILIMINAIYQSHQRRIAKRQRA